MLYLVKCPRCAGFIEMTMPGLSIAEHLRPDGVQCALSGSLDEGKSKFQRLQAKNVYKQFIQIALEVLDEHFAVPTEWTPPVGASGPWVHIVSGGGGPGSGKRS